MSKQEFYMPNESVLNQAEVNPLQKFFSEARTREEDFDPQKISEQIARGLCEPKEEIYKRNPKLAKDPIKAIESVSLVGSGEKEIADPVEGLVVAAAKLETARNELGLGPKEAEVFNGFLENIQGAAAFLRNKTVRGVATGALIVSQALTAAGCKGVIPTYVDPEPTISPTVEVTDIPTPTDIPTSTATLEPTPSITPTETVQAEEMRVLLSEKIEYEGLSYDFEITIPKDDNWVNSNFEKYGIESLKINEDKPNARELLAKVFAVKFLETYNFQNGTNVSLDEFVGNLEKYPVEIVMRDADRQLTPKTLTLDQIKSFELRLISENDQGGLYMNMPRYTSLLSGYGFENGKFVLCSSLTGTFSSLESTSSKFGKESEWFSYYPYLVGYKVADMSLGSALGQMPYTVFILVQHNRDEILKNENIFTTFDDTVDFDAIHRPSYINTNIEEDLKWRKQHVIFTATIR